MPREHALAFPCNGASLIGVLHEPDNPKARGVVIVPAGGPQYRVGAHRWYLLLARTLAEQGFPVLRFDFRGMGDGGGEFEGYLHIADDIRSAVDKLQDSLPQVKSVFLFGECNAASAITLYGHTDQRIGGMGLMNPWVRTEFTAARTYLRHYYGKRLLQLSFWRKLFSGAFSPVDSLKSFFGMVRTSIQRRPASSSGDTAPASDLPTQMAASLRRFDGRLLIVMSGNDYIAREFEEVENLDSWKGLLGGDHVTRHHLEEADHTFSRREWREQLYAWSSDWLRAGA